MKYKFICAVIIAYWLGMGVVLLHTSWFLVVASIIMFLIGLGSDFFTS